MDAKILQNESQSERINILKDNAEKMEELTYPKSLGSDELTQIKSEFTKESILLAKEDELKKDYLQGYKSKVTPIKLKLSELMGKIRTKVEEVTEDVYLIADQEEGVMGYYNDQGVLVMSRPLFPEERQLKIINEKINKAN